MSVFLKSNRPFYPFLLLIPSISVVFRFFTAANAEGIVASSYPCAPSPFSLDLWRGPALHWLLASVDMCHRLYSVSFPISLPLNSSYSTVLGQPLLPNSWVLPFSPALRVSGQHFPHSFPLCFLMWVVFLLVCLCLIWFLFACSHETVL